MFQGRSLLGWLSVYWPFLHFLFSLQKRAFKLVLGVLKFLGKILWSPIYKLWSIRRLKKKIEQTVKPSAQGYVDVSPEDLGNTVKDKKEKPKKPILVGKTIPPKKDKIRQQPPGFEDLPQGPTFDEEPKMRVTAKVSQDKPAASKKSDKSTKPISRALPSPKLLKMYPSTVMISREKIDQMAHQLAEKCGEFGVTGEISDYHHGPVVTTYEFQLDPGIKYSKVVNLQDDLCLALKAPSIRIARMTGKSTIGLEVPNLESEIIGFRDIVEDKKFQKE